MKNKETLEEAAERLIQDYNGDISQKLIAYTFITVGAKWQQEQDKKLYSEEDILKAFDAGLEYMKYGDLNKKEWFKQFKKK